MADLMSEMERQANRDLVKYAVMQAMFCPGKHCGGKILDMRRAVLVTVADRNAILCGDCWDKSKEELTSKVAASGRDIKIEVLDGRELFKKAPRAAAAAGRKAKLNLEEVMAAAESDEYIGFCRACGNSQGECEPDARKRTCEACGAAEVYGAEEIILMGGAQ